MAASSLPPIGGTYDKSACIGKQAFPTKAEALRILKLRNSRHGWKARHRAMNVYHCGICHAWHHGGKAPS